MSAILSTLSAHGIVGASIAAEHHGSAVVRYDVALPAGTRVDAVHRLSDELAMATASRAVRIAPVPGTSYVGIEVPDEDRPTVAVQLAQDALPSLTFHVGNGTDGEPVYADLAKLPHLLIAGATGSGKSVAMTSLITQLMGRNRPDEVRFLMADPKRVELTAFATSPHLAGEVAYEVTEMLGMLDLAVEEMDGRYEMMRAGNVNNVMDLPGRPFAYLMVVLDEIADLMIQTKGAAEAPLARLCQLGRAAGVHVVMATQYPKADVLTSLISANVPSRLVFSVMSHTQSKVALGETGAEALLGQGDGLLRVAGAPNVVRILSPYVSQGEAREAATLWLSSDVVAPATLTPDAQPAPAPLYERIDTTVVESRVDPAQHLYAPDGTPMGPDDRICYVCSIRRAFPGATVCISPDCDTPDWNAIRGSVSAVPASVASVVATGSAWSRWRHRRRAARNLRAAA